MRILSLLLSVCCLTTLVATEAEPNPPNAGLGALRRA
jgi:hypothetical protein